MELSRTTNPEHARSPRKPRPQGAPLSSQARERAGDLAFVKLDCSQCGDRFLLDVEEHLSRSPAEMEAVGRKFLGVPADAVLCPRCLHDVETAGAERIYWARAGG